MRDKKRRSLRRRLVTILTVLVLLFCALAVYYDRVVNPYIVNMSEAKVRSLATKSVNTAFNEILSGYDVYSDLIEINMDTEGNVTSILTNSIKINKLSQDLIISSQEKISELGQQGINVPLGNFTGLSIFAGRGPNIRVRIIPLGSVTAQFISVFKSAGINQTNHKIYVKLTATVSLLLPVKSQRIIVDNELLIAESIIVGKVPDTYLNSNSLGDMFNLVPNNK